MMSVTGDAIGPRERCPEMWFPIWPGLDPRPRMQRAREKYARKVNALPTVRVARDILAGRLDKRSRETGA